MKAYQMKIAIKGSHPPIWRRAVVPAGLSFSQLSVVLNEVMGWCGYHLSAFEFYYQGVRLEEEPEMDYIGEYELYDSAEYIIDSWMESEEWFTYCYDFGDDWEHRVTIEKVLPDYEYLYPTVLKFKGDTPYEDCGGIRGYYELLDILKEPANSRYEELKEWTENHFTEEYNLDRVNLKLKKLALKGEKSSPMSQNQIYEEAMNGKPFRKIQGKYDLDGYEEVRDELAEELDGEAFWQEVQAAVVKKALGNLKVPPSDICLKDILDEYDKDSLVKICKIHGLRGYTKYRKAELKEFLARELMSREVFCRFATFLQDEEIALLDQGTEKGGGRVQEWPVPITYLVVSGYAGGVSLEHVLIPGDVWDTYLNYCDATWKKERSKIWECLNIMNGAAMLYGVCPIEVFQKVYEKAVGKKITEQEVVRFCDEVPPYKRSFQLKERELVWNEVNHEEVVQEMKMYQQGKEFYLPTLQEVRTLGERGYLPFDKHMLKLQNYLRKELREESEDAEYYCKEIQQHIRIGEGMEEVLDVLFDEGVMDEDDLTEDLLELLRNVIFHTRMIALMGFTCKEDIRKNQPEIIDFQKRKEKKVYPNDPCPCGSGKKYKRCCGKKKCRRL